jgi:hypothetical protein
MESTTDLSARVQQLVDEDDMEKALLKSYDLADLFVHYYVRPVIAVEPYNCTNWGEFTSQLADWEDNIADSKVSVGDFRQWIQPLESVLNVDLVAMHTMMCSRRTVTHTDLRAAHDQVQFVYSLSSFSLPNSFPYKAIFDALMKKMQAHTQFKRKYSNTS